MNQFGIDKTEKTSGVIIKNVLTQHSLLFVNNNTLTENIVSYIILHIKKSSGSLLLSEYREKVKKEAKITESISKITKCKFAFSEKFDLHAKFE